MGYKNEDRQWLHNVLQTEGYDVGSYDEFEKSLQIKEDADWYFDEARKLGLEIGDRSEFDALMGLSNEKKSEGTPLYAMSKEASGGALPTLEEQAKPNSQLKFGKPGFIQDEATALRPMSDTSVAERLSNPRILGENNNIRAVQEAEEEANIDKIFVSKPMNTPKDVYDNYSARFTNTQRGIELGEELASITKGIQDKYLKEYLGTGSYKALTEKYQGEELAKQANEQFARMYGELIEAELEPYQKAYNDELNLRYGSQMEGELNRISKDEAGVRLGELSSSVDSELDNIEEKIDARTKAVRNVNWRPGMPSSRDDNTLKELRGQRTYLNGAKELIEESQKIIQAAKDAKDGTAVGGVLRGVRDKAFDIDTWTMGLSDLVGGMRLNNILEKVEKGEKLTSAEEMLFDASVNNMAINYYYQNDLGKGYMAGQVTGESLPFMLEMIVNPISASGNVIAKRLLNAGLKKFAKNKAAQVGARLVGDATAAIGMSSTTGMPSIIGDTYRRMNENYNYGVDAEGNLYANKKADAMGMGEAFARSFTTRAIENQSEMIFNAFKGMGGFMKGVEKVLPGGVNKFFDMLSHNKVADAYRWLKNSPVFRNYLVKDVRNATQIGGIFEEYAEEVYNNLANFAIGEMSWEDVVSLDKNIDTFLGLAPTQVMFGILGLGGAASMRYQTRKTLEDLQATMNEQQRKELEGLLDMGIDAREVDVRGFIRGVMENQNYTIENKRDLIKAAYYVAQQRSIDELTEADVIDKVNAENQFIDSMTDPSTGNYAELSRTVVNSKTGESEQQKGYVVGWIGEGEKRQPIFVADGMENNYANRVVLKPTEWSMDSYREMPAEQVKAVNEEMNREEAAQQAERESKYAPEVLNAQMPEGEFTMGGRLFVPSQVTSDGVVYDIFDLNEKGKPTTTIPVESRPVPIDEYRDMLQAQIDAQEAAAPVNVPSGESVGEEVNAEVNAPVNNENVQPVAEGVATESQVAQPQAPIIPTKEDGSIDFVSYGKEGTFKTLGEKYGEKMPNKVAITAKALAEDVKKAQKKLNNAEEAYDNAPIGREQKAEEARDKAKAELEAIQREANFWAEMDAEIKEAQAVRESMLNPQAEVNTSSEPLTADEFVAQQLASGNIVLNKEDYKRETGYGDEEVKAMNGGSKKLLTGDGMTIQEAGERLMEMDRENGTNFFDQSDPNAGRDELLSVLGSVKTRKELNQYVASNRVEQAKRDSEGLYNELERQVMDAHYASLEDYVLQMEASEMENMFDGIDVATKDAIFAEAEEEYQQYLNSLENGQGTTSETVEGSDNVLSEEQSDNTGGIAERQEQGDGVGEGASEESERAYAATEELKQEEGETTLQFAERAAEENDRREPLRNRAREWAVKLGVTVNLIESVHDVYNIEALAAIQSGQRVTGWFEESTGEVCFYMPFLDSESEVDATFIHEVVAHKGLRGLLGEKFDAFCDEVWDVMSNADRVKFMAYPGVSHLEGKKKSRAAADEYIAHLAENVDVTESAWSKLTELIKRFLKAIGLEPKMTNADIANTIKKSYQRLLEGEESVESFGNGTRFNAKRTSDRRQDMNHINNTVDQALSLVTGKDIKDVKSERVKKAQKRKEDAAEIYQSVLSGDFNDVTLQKINDYIDDATPLHPYGRRISQRLPQKLERSLHEGSRTNAVDALFSRICESSVPASRRTSEAGRREIEERKKEALKGWAIATNNWHTDLSEFTDEQTPFAKGTDSEVFLSKDGKYVIKTSFGKPEGKRFRPDIDNIPLFNSVFRNSAYEIVGYGEFDGKFARILKQPFVEFAEDSKVPVDERVDYMRTLGFEPINEAKTAFSNGTIIVADLQKSNIVKTAQGNIRVIDADVKLHTKDVGGSYTYPPVEADLPEGKISFRISSEEKSIIDKAKADGTYMKAPNGNPTNLTEKQWVQVRTKAFKKWFGDWVNDPANASKVVDENGEPLVMIHNSTTSGITEFKPNVGNAIFFADKIAQNYVSGFERGENNYEVFLNIGNPHTESYEAAFIDEANGIDGVFVTAEVDEGIGHAAIVKKPNQIKSATDNVGIFDEGNNDIRFRVTPEHKQHQMDIINETNPAPDSNYTWIRSVDDIKSFEEALDDSDYADYKGEDFDPSYTWAMAEKALRDGKVIVYSSYPIKNGVFVTPSYMEAQSYGGTTPYMAKVNLEDVAWIDPTQGQLATDSKVKSKKAASGVRFRMTNAEKEALRDSEESKALFDYAKKRFGRTFDLREAVYVLPDGSMLDFSGRHEMAPGSDTSFLRGNRSVDHRGIVDVVYDFEGEETGFKTDMADFLNRGAIRIDGSTGAIDLTMKPTSKQKDILRRLVQRMDGDVWIDFSEGWDSEHYVEYAGVKPMRVISDIDKYYDEGIKPEGNARFRISNKNQEIFVSNAQKAVEGIKQEKATPQQWIAMIEKNGGLKAGEDKWLGLSDWLEGLDKVTKDNYYISTKANFTKIDDVDGRKDLFGIMKYLKEKGFEEHASPYKGSISRYWFDKETGDVYRMSDHWGEVASCTWSVDRESTPISGKSITIAKANLKDFKRKPLTKAEILEFIGENKIQIEEVHYSGAGFNDEYYADDVPALVSDVLTAKEGALFADKALSAFEFEYDDYREVVDCSIEDEELAVEMYNDNNSNKIEFNEEQGLTSRERRTINYWMDEIVSKAMKVKNQGDTPINATRLEYTTKGLENKREIALTVPTIESWNEDDEIHFGDAGEGRAIAWIRFGETRGEVAEKESVDKFLADMRSKYNAAEGEETDYMNEDEVKQLQTLTSNEIEARETAPRILVIDEIQSKRHQEGREKGYKSQADKTPARMEDLTFGEYNGLITATYKGERLYFSKEKSKEEILEMINERIADGQLGNANNLIPDAPFEKNWSELAFKRMLRYAAENGFDKVAWTTGAQQAERYNIGGVVSSINYFLRGDGSYRVETYGSNGYQIESIPTEFKDGQALADVFGKELATKMVKDLEEDRVKEEEAKKSKKEIRAKMRELDDESAEYESLLEEFGKYDSVQDTINAGHEISGDGLRVGGEGMKGFYDKMLPSFVNKYVKKWGTKVQDIELPNVEEAGRIMHSVDVTEAMKESVMEGQTMFRVVKDPAVDYISQAEDVVEVPREEVMYTMNNIANQLYKVSGRFMRELYKYGTIGRVLKGEYAEIDQIKAKREYNHAKPIFDEYLNELVWMKYQSTEAAQEVINDVISDVEYAMQYYKDLALGKDVWRTKNSPRFRITEKHRKDVSKAIADFTSSYNSKPVSYITNDMTDEQVDDLLEGYLDSEDVQRMKNEGAHGFYLRKIDRIYIFVDDIPLEAVENSMFHENLHLLLGANNPLTSVLWDKAKSESTKFNDALKKIYKPHELAEEYFVYKMAKGLTDGEVETFISDFAGTDKEALFNILNTLGYEYESESRERLERRRRIGGIGDALRQGGKSGERRSGESREALARKAGERKERLQQLFGRVADMGLDGVLGNKEYVNAMVDMYKVLPEAVQREVADEALSRYGGSIAPAVSDWLNHKAEASVWDKVVAVIREVLRKVGFDLDLNTNEAKYILWRSQKPLNRNNLLELAEDIDMKNRLKVGEYSTNDDGTTPDGGGTKFRESKEKLEDSSRIYKDFNALHNKGTRFRVSGKLNVRDEYEATIKKGGFQAREAVQDAMLSLRKFQELIEKVSGKKVRDFENAWMHENRLSSVVQAQIHEMERKFYKPMMDAVKKLMAVANLEQEQVADYLMLKHGIERNREMAVRKALTDSEGKIDRTRLEQWYQDKRNVRSRAATPHLDTWRKQQEELDNIALMYGADMSRDYSGLTSMFGTDDLADSTQQAYDEVEALETAHPAETEALGKAIKAMTQNTLDESFGSGLMDRKVYDELSKDMYDYYIPLRGFDETTSEEVYAYLDQDRGAFNAPLIRAKGRSSKSDNPIAYLKSIAESGIMQGERNKMKQSFLNLVINNPSDLVSVREGVWVIYNPASGEWEAATPPAIPNNATPADVEAAMEAWETNMESLAASDPNVKKVSEAQDIPYRVIGNRMNQHQVIVKRLGKSYTLTINGNPRLAMALNGLTNPNNKSNDGKVAAYVSSKIDTLNRTLSAWYTTRNPDFVASNFMRDTFYTNTIVRAKEGNAYANKFHKNYGKVLPQMLILFSKYEKGTLNPADKTEAAFLDFMMNGGETGYSNLKDLEHIKKQIAKELKESKWDKAVTAVNLKALRRENVEALAEKIDILNRAVENTARFAAFLTSREEGRSIAKSVFDAKEISVNFNKKGAGGTFFGMTGQTGFGNLAAMVGAGGRALYVFFNAAIQGTTNLMHVMKVNPKGTSAGLAAMFLMGAVVPFLFGGDDDDEKDYYDLPEHVRRNHLIIPGTGDAWISIPLPIEYRIMYGMGELLSSWRSGHERGSDIARKMLNLTGQALPLNFLEEGLEVFVPSAVSPIYQVMTNSSWTGLPIYKENDDNKSDPEYTKAYSNVDRNLLKFTKALYEWTFDEENQEDGIDLNPAIIETLAKGYFGGLATQLSNLAKVGGMIAGEQEFDWRNIPIGNRILKTGDERTKEKRVTNEYFKNMEQLDFLQSRERMLKKAEKGVAVPEADKFKAQKDLETMRGTEIYKKYQEFKKQKKVVDKIQRKINEKGLTPELEKQRMEAREAANKAVR